MDIIDETGTFYIDNFEYGFNGCDPGIYWIDKIYNSEGYYNEGPNNYRTYYYYRKDHLGNNREVWRTAFTAFGTTYPATTIQRTQYYPSGLPWAEGEGQEVQNKKYNGKEWIEAHGLDEYYSQARMYYPAIMRTTTLDPLAEKYYSISPYAWCGNNPVNAVDPDGMQNVATLPYNLYRTYRLYRAYRAAQVTVAAGGVFALGCFGVDYYNGQKMKQRANEVRNSLIQRANLSEEHTHEAKASTPEQRREQKRREAKSRQEDAKTAKAHNDMVNNDVGSPSPDGSPDPKKPLNDWSTVQIIVGGVGNAAILYDNISKPEKIEPIPVPDIPKPEPPKIVPTDPNKPTPIQQSNH